MNRNAVILLIIIIAISFHSPGAANNEPKIQYKYPFYCSKDVVQYLAFGARTAALNYVVVVCYEGSPITLTIIGDGKIISKEEIVVPDVYHTINVTTTGPRVLVESNGESSFDIDYYTLGKHPEAPPSTPERVLEGYWIEVLGSIGAFTECSADMYKITIVVPHQEELFEFSTRGMDGKGEIWMVDHRGNESVPKYGPLEPSGEGWKGYDLWLEARRDWDILFSNLKGADVFFVRLDYGDSLYVDRPQKFGPETGGLLIE